MFVVDYLTQELTGGGEGAMTRIPIEKKEPLRAELEAFVESVARGSPPPMPGGDALVAVEVAARLVESGRTGRVVQMSAQPIGESEV
jgi:predicted dehydrogenase